MSPADFWLSKPISVPCAFSQLLNHTILKLIILMVSSPCIFSVLPFFVFLFFATCMLHLFCQLCLVFSHALDCFHLWSLALFCNGGFRSSCYLVPLDYFSPIVDTLHFVTNMFSLLQNQPQRSASTCTQKCHATSFFLFWVLLPASSNSLSAAALVYYLELLL